MNPGTPNVPIFKQRVLTHQLTSKEQVILLNLAQLSFTQSYYHGKYQLYFCGS
jgi:hypothetical protein